MEATGKGVADKKLKVMTAIIVSIAVECFGDEEKGPRTPYVKNQRAVRIQKIRKELNSLKSQFKEVGEEVCIGLAQLTFIL